ncbi:MAG: hypothetical protein J2P57_14750 [Acidimicrobiaceae bacterium]|nr:hypothetical protein [Acidimicrobiaceae bacterium]
MPKGIMYVETRPSSPERQAEFDKWYDEVHLKEVCGIDGVLSARRYTPIDGEGPFVAVYELEADDLGSVIEQLGKKSMSGEIHMSDALQLDPPPVVRILELTSGFKP